MDSAINSERLLATFRALLGINAPSCQEGPVAAFVREALADLGPTIVTDDADIALDAETGNMIVRLPGTVDAEPILFCAHLDTVEPTRGLVIVEKDGVFRTDGTTILGADDRAGVAAILEAVRALRESGAAHPPLELAFTIAEEVGLMGSQVMDYDLLTARCGFVPDSTGPVGAIIVRAPEQRGIHATISGTAAHAGIAPETGVCAIVTASRAIARMKLGRIDLETTANIGIIGGGKATNIVCDRVEAQGEVRSRNPQALAEQVAHMVACFEEEAAAMGAKAEVVVTDVYPAFNLAEDSRPVTLAAAAARSLGVTPTIRATGGGSDANFLNDHGIPSVILSAGYESAHCTGEHIPAAQLVLLAEWLYGIAVQAAV